MHAAAGAVSSCLIQFARKHPISILGTVGSPDKASYASQLGASPVFGYGDGRDFASDVMDATSGAGVDVIFDCVGAETAAGNTECLAAGGQLLYYGSASGHGQYAGERLLTKRLRVEGFVIFSLFERPLVWSYGVSALLGSLRDGSLSLDVSTLPLSDVAKAHRMIEDRSLRGKVVLDTR
ncbi:MAG TPA: zinc-binding dehydrogenase [Frankiaceae bacterium]|nr:zinc-binding dehydrogenase [Frankiaceae bacterium]